MLRLLLLVSLCTTVFSAEQAPRHTWDLIYPAAAHPDKYVEKLTGHFGVKFVGIAQRRFFPTPIIPKRIKGTTEPGVVQAALLIGKDGRVKEVSVIAMTPEDVVDDAVLSFLRGIIFVEKKEGKKRIEYETELVVAFRPFKEKND